MNLPKHECSLSINHNCCRDYYQTVEQWVDQDDGCIKPEWKDEASKQQAIDTNEIWTMQWYPITPIGNHYVAAPTLEELLDWALQYEEQT